MKELIESQTPLVISHEDDLTYNIEHVRMIPLNGYANVDIMVSYKYYMPKWDFARQSNKDYTVKSVS